MRCEHHRGAARPANRRRKWLGFDDHEGWVEFSNSESRSRVCKGRHPLQCRGTRRSGYANAPEQSQRLGATGRKKGDGEGYCRCGSLPGKGRSCERRDTPRGWRGSGASLVAIIAGQGAIARVAGRKMRIRWTLVVALVFFCALAIHALQHDSHAHMGNQSADDPDWSELTSSMEKMHAAMAAVEPSGATDVDFVR